jgi:predicted regulator of Ras-like GTPase activity (Roadblock/LC7/MglB family)
MNPLSGPTATASARTPGDVAWLIKQFADDAPGVTHAVVVSLDGLQLAASGAVERDLGDQIAALTAGLLSMATRCGELLSLGTTEHLTVRLPRGHLLFMRIGESAGLAVAAAIGADLRVLAYQMTQFVTSVGHALTPQVRGDLHRLTVTPSTR